MGWLDSIIGIGKQLIGGLGSTIGTIAKPIKTIAQNFINTGVKTVGDAIGGVGGSIASVFGGDRDEWSKKISGGVQSLGKVIMPLGKMALSTMGGPLGMAASTLLDFADSDEEDANAAAPTQLNPAVQQEPDTNGDGLPDFGSYPVQEVGRRKQPTYVAASPRYQSAVRYGNMKVRQSTMMEPTRTIRAPPVRAPPPARRGRQIVENDWEDEEEEEQYERPVTKRRKLNSSASRGRNSAVRLQGNIPDY